MYKKKLLITKVVSASLLIFSVLLYGSSYTSTAAEDSTYYTNSDGRAVRDIFSLNLGDISRPFDWLKRRNTYVVTEVAADGKEVFWFNVPNIQQLLYNQVLQLLPTGYQGSGSVPSEEAFLVEIPPASEAKTGMQRYGFSIPNPAYVGEYPKVYISLMGVLVEDNPADFIVSKVRGLFGGSLVSAPDKSDLHTLTYLSPDDYAFTNNSFEKWIELYWPHAMSVMAPGQILISNSEDGIKGGVSYTKQTVLTDTGLDRMRDPKVINQQLKELLGPEYTDVVTNIIAVSGKGFTNAPTRVMPYDLDTLVDSDRKSLKVSDPRVTYQTKLDLGFMDVPLGLDKVFVNELSSYILSFAGFVNELTVYVNGLVGFGALEELGIDPVSLWSTPIGEVVTVVCAILALLFITARAVNFVRGSEGFASAFSKSLGALGLICFVWFITAAPQSFYKPFKSVTDVVFNVGALTVAHSSVASDLVSSQATYEEAAANSYWLPYFSLWTEYHTGYALRDNKIDRSLDSVVSEQKEMDYPTIAGEEVALWSALLAESFTSGQRIKNDAYRVVDHFMAPRVSFDSSTKKVSAVQNENYNGKFQDHPDVGVFAFLLLVAFGVFVKFLLFLESAYYLATLQVNLALGALRLQDSGRAFKKLFASVLNVGVWDCCLAVLVYISLVATGLAAVVLALLCAASIYGLASYLHRRNSVFCPTFLKATLDFKYRHSF